jgi:hypothetical protein
MTIRRLTFEIKKLENRCVQIKADAEATGVIQDLLKVAGVIFTHTSGFPVFQQSTNTGFY